ncbi:MAG: SagB/ThcOx family dehydrogenase [Deltaproteobacteria bacterium]|jgi:hypothetical protein|nr:SagB/ThcOx family dehydrogenase [Deltaproteobacteria bacterium]
MKSLFAALLITLALWPSALASAADSAIIALPDPQKSGGGPILEALANRKSERAFKAQTFDLQSLSTIFWCAFGVNRPDGKRVIPTYRNQQELEVYAVLPSGVFLYQPLENNLKKVLDGDFTLDYGGSPLTLLYAGPTANGQIGGLHAGSAYQNVSLYCASEKIANVVKVTGINLLKDKLKLQKGWQVLVVQSIGYSAGIEP